MKTELKDYVLSSIAIILIFASVALIAYISRQAFQSLHLGVLAGVVYILLFIFLYGTVTTLYVRLLNRVLPLNEGRYDMDHPQFTLWKHHAVVSELGKDALKPFFPIFLRPLYYKIFGARVGKGVAIAGIIVDSLMVQIEDFGVLGQDSVLTSHLISQNSFFLKQITVKRGATVGVNAVLMPGVVVGENSFVAPGAVVLVDTTIPPNEFWGGVPAKRLKGLPHQT